MAATVWIAAFIHMTSHPERCGHLPRAGQKVDNAMSSAIATTGKIDTIVSEYMLIAPI